MFSGETFPRRNIFIHLIHTNIQCSLPRPLPIVLLSKSLKTPQNRQKSQISHRKTNTLNAKCQATGLSSTKPTVRAVTADAGLITQIQGGNGSIILHGGHRE